MLSQPDVRWICFHSKCSDGSRLLCFFFLLKTANFRQASTSRHSSKRINKSFAFQPTTKHSEIKWANMNQKKKWRERKKSHGSRRWSDVLCSSFCFNLPFFPDWKQVDLSPALGRTNSLSAFQEVVQWRGFYVMQWRLIIPRGGYSWEELQNGSNYDSRKQLFLFCHTHPNSPSPKEFDSFGPSSYLPRSFCLSRASGAVFLRDHMTSDSAPDAAEQQRRE